MGTTTATGGLIGLSQTSLRALPSSGVLGEPVRPFQETFSVVTLLQDAFFSHLSLKDVPKRKAGPASGPASPEYGTNP